MPGETPSNLRTHNVDRSAIGRIFTKRNVGLSLTGASLAAAGLGIWIETLPDPCKVVITKADDGRSTELQAASGSTVWVQPFFDNPSRVQVFVGNTPHDFTTATMNKPGPELVYNLDQTTKVLMEITPDSLSTSCQTRG